MLSYTPANVVGFTARCGRGSLPDAHVLQTLLEEIINGGAAQTEIWVSKNGSDSTGSGSILNPVASLTKAMTLVTASRKNIFVLPGTYTEAATLVWPLITGVRVHGLGTQWDVVLGVTVAEGVDEVIRIQPGVQTATFEAALENIQIDHDTAGLDGINLVNTSMTKKLNLYLSNVSFEADSDSDKSILMTHGDADNAIRIYAQGGAGGNVTGAISWSAKNNGDRLYCTDMNLDGGIVTSTDNMPLDIQLVRCRVKHEGVSGGHATQTVAAVKCYTLAAGTFAKLDTNDLAGSHTEQIVD